ncbi:uncharacterized protein LOC132204131 isoform X2 [Neocloeon triangulifer]|uniref:uncharacterized protein LOC132204131 isoform X2 n=1 Tax=Neocloeon triangulifer TaxID=2078957 RepID=UPI00286F2888|nr:uncharacterized protein LOC132204131 isoform X2 [Neocloeon triangulifer]
MMACNIVVEWLRSLQLQQYSDSFLDNGYDDLEICKQVGDPDLDAIGVLNPQHRHVLLQSVRSLREEGAASVYFTLEPKDEEISSPGEATSPIGAASAADRSYADEYEEGKAELVRIPKMQLKLLLREKLAQDGVRLSFQPYSTASGERGYLEGLASRYADRFNTHYQDVLEHLEELRRQEWDDLSPRMSVVQSNLSTPGTPPFPGPLLLASSGGGGLYAPGKYSPSSCLSDKEEDEIYGFGYGIYGRQMLQRQQQQLAAQTAAPIYQSCLSPRSAYFYEFPPGDNASSSKKKTTFSRLLRTLRPHRKEKHIPQVSPTNRQQPRSIMPPCTSVVPPTVNVSSRVSTPDEPVPPDYDHVRLIQINRGGAGGFEETIQRLKMQDAIKKKERFHKEQEEILRDIRHGLMQIGLNTTPSTASIPHYPSVSDDTYMYDDDIQQQPQQPQKVQRPRPPLHWYDEPPYESDPEDFLMGGLAASRAVFQNGRVCFTLNLKQEPRGEGVISLRSAGDISVPKEASWRRGARPKRILNRESGDYAGSDIHSVGSRLSTISVETNRSEQEGKTRSHSSEEAQSPNGPSDNEDGSKASRSMRHDKKRLRACEATDKENRSDNGEHQRHQFRTKNTVEYPPSIGKAKALVDCVPSPYDKESLRFKKGDIIDIISMNVSGNWKGYAHGRIGTFKFIHVELISAAPGPIGPVIGRKGSRGGMKEKPKNVEELLRRVNMEAFTSLFVMNGYEDLELFKELEESDLDFLGIRNADLRAKVLAAVAILMEYESPSESGDEASSSDSSARLSQSGKVPFKRLDLGRDSGCYASSNEQPSAGPSSEKPADLDKRPVEAPRSATASPRSRSASAAVASALAAASLAAAQSKEKQQTVPRTPSYDFRAEYDKLKGKLEASLTKGPLAADGQKAESAVAAGIRCFSEKSSDSGISSSSRSPPPATQVIVSPTTKPEKPEA